MWASWDLFFPQLIVLRPPLNGRNALGEVGVGQEPPGNGPWGGATAV